MAPKTPGWQLYPDEYYSSDSENEAEDEGINDTEESVGQAEDGD